MRTARHGADLSGMLVPDEGHGPRLPWDRDRGSGFPRPGGLLRMDVGSLLRSLPATVRVARDAGWG